MDINILTFKITEYIIAFDNFTSLEELQLDEQAELSKKLEEIKERHSRHILELLPNLNLYDSERKLLPHKIFIGELKLKLMSLGKKEIEDYIEIFKKDTARITKLYKRIKKS